MKLLLVLEYDSIEHLQEQLNNTVINDWGSQLLNRVAQCAPGLLWDDQGVLIATLDDSTEIDQALSAP